MGKDGRKFIKIPKIWLQTEGNSNSLIDKYGNMAYCFYVYCVLFHNKMESGGSVTLYNFIDMFGFNNNRTNRNNKTKELVRVIKLLERDGLITLYSDFTFTSSVAFSDNIDNNKLLHIETNIKTDSKFFILYKDEIAKILNSDGDRLQLLVHLSIILTHINNKSNLAYVSLDAMCELTNISKNTCIKNNKLLYELELIYYESVGLMLLSDDYFKSYTNTYSRYVDKQYVVDYIDKQRSNNKIRISNNSKLKQERANKMRSLKHRINNLTKKRGGGELLDSEIYELRKFQSEYDELVRIRDSESESN